MGEPEAEGRPTGPVLIAEDDASFAAFVGEVLAADDLEAIIASDGAEALELARAQRPLAAILDVNLPKLSGYEVCRGLRELYGDGLPILFLSGVRMESFDRIAGLMIGADDYLMKPFATDELLTRLRSLLRRAEEAEAPRPHDLTKRDRPRADHEPVCDLHLLEPGRQELQHLERILAKLGV